MKNLKNYHKKTIQIYLTNIVEQNISFVVRIEL